MLENNNILPAMGKPMGLGIAANQGGGRTPEDAEPMHRSQAEPPPPPHAGYSPKAQGLSGSKQVKP